MNKLYFGLVSGALYFILAVYLLSIGSGGMFFVFMCGWYVPVRRVYHLV